jgi:uncharacterized protein (TIGR02246 family)
MKIPLVWFMPLVALTLGVTAPTASVRQAPSDPKDVAALWVEDGDFTDQAGRHLKGRAALEKAFQQAFAENTPE